MTTVEATTASSTTTLCEACGENPASVFTPDFALCKPCRKHQLEHPTVSEAAARHARALGGAGNARFARSPQDPTVEEQALVDWVEAFADDVDFTESEAVR